MNKWLGIGNLARDPEYGTTQGGISYCRFTVACQRRFANQQGVREADFIDCVAWRQTADFVNRYFIKGNKIVVEGTLQCRSYDAQDGTKRYVKEIIVENVEFAGPKQDGGQRTTSGDPGPTPPPAPPQQGEQQRMDLYGNGSNDFVEVEDDDDLPF